MYINLNSEKKFDLINYANLKLGLLQSKNFLDFNQLRKFKDINLGFPIILNKQNIFFYPKNEQNEFKVTKEFFQKYIFRIKKRNYGPLKKLFSNGNTFVYNVKLKKRYEDEFNKIYNHNKKLIKFIKELKKKNKTITAFQTRNIPHLGHEKIIEYLLKRTDVLIINPVIGPKKKGDIKYEFLKKFYEHIIKTKYKRNKVFYYPVIANMFYSGPREAIHHSILRKNLGFDQFLVGRDHAGSENVYKPNLAYQTVKKVSKKLGIKILAYKGSYFCKTCNRIVEKGACKYKKKKCKYENISGKTFRKYIKNKKYFAFADKDLQNYIFKFKNIFS